MKVAKQIILDATTDCPRLWYTTEQMHQEGAERFQASISERLSSQSF